jgi:5-carboxymethyl-2-hydroxymuconate isomerase
MPHLRLSSSPGALTKEEAGSLLRELCTVFCLMETVDSATVKAYFSEVQDFVMGEGAPDGFVHLEASILTGRTEELRGRIAKDLVQVMKKHLDSRGLSITVEVREMDKAGYAKGH